LADLDARASATVKAMNSGGGGAGGSHNNSNNMGNQEPTLYSTEIEVNDYPVNARVKVTSQEFQKQITSMFQTVFVVRGSYVPIGRSLKKDERKLHIMLEGQTRQQVEKAKAEINRVLYEASMMMGRH
jgi:hypothetical protein